MRILKIICLFFVLLSVASIIEGSRAIHSMPLGTASREHRIFTTILSVIGAVFWACAFYGIQRKAPIAWKLGWTFIVVGLLEFLISGLSSTMRLPETDHPWIASAAVLIIGSAVGVYWSLWWKRQRPYFAAGAQHDNH